MRALLFSFLLNNIPLSSLSVLAMLLSFLFIFPPFRISFAPSLSCTYSIYSPHFAILLQLLIRSLPHWSACSVSFVFHRRCRVAPGLRVRVAGSTSYPICLSIMRSCLLNPALIHQPAAQPVWVASFYPPFPIDKW